MNAPLAIVMTTLDDQDQAQRLGRQLVEEGLVACVQIESAPVHSVYRWEGVVQSASEWRLMLKLSSSGVDRLRERLLEIHPYETPEFMVLGAEASRAYASWIRDCCA